MKALLLLIPLLLCTQGVQAQQVGDCQNGSDTANLDVGDVRAALYNNGSLFWRGSGNVYEVPKGSGVQSIFVNGLWIGGIAEDGSPRFSGTIYGPWTYWPGPLDTNGDPPDDCDDYDRMYSVYDADVRAYEADGTLTDDLRDWPVHLGAPVVDGDGIGGNYDLAAGDRPEIYGEQSVWWVMNDAGNVKEWSTTPPIGVEVRVHAFAAACWPFEPRVPALNQAINQNTYYHFTLIHKGSEPLRDTYIGWYTDGDLGNPDNDYVASDTTLQMMYYYNGQEDDAVGVRPTSTTPHYGEPPPAIGYLLARGPHLSSRNASQPPAPLGFTNIMNWDMGTTIGGAAIQHAYMRSAWPAEMYGRESPLTLGGTGFGGTTPIRYSFPGDPVTQAFWSEENVDGSGSRNTAADRNILASSGPFDFAPGDTTTFTLAIVWAQGQDRLDSVRLLRQRAHTATSALDVIMMYDAYSCAPSAEAEAPDPNALGYYVLRQNYPEPFSGQTTIRYEVINTVPVQLTVYDLLGRRVRTLVDGTQEAGVYDVVFEASDLPTGTYFYRLEAAGYVSITRRMVLQR
ncbi:MAG: T9SS type A sorting domain-containing protein [Bacteroidota bacterium]